MRGGEVGGVKGREGREKVMMTCKRKSSQSELSGQDTNKLQGTGSRDQEQERGKMGRCGTGGLTDGKDERNREQKIRPGRAEQGRGGELIGGRCRKRKEKHCQGCQR